MTPEELGYKLGSIEGSVHSLHEKVDLLIDPESGVLRRQHRRMDRFDRIINTCSGILLVLVVAGYVMRELLLSWLKQKMGLSA